MKCQIPFSIKKKIIRRKYFQMSSAEILPSMQIIKLFHYSIHIATFRLVGNIMYSCSYSGSPGPCKNAHLEPSRCHACHMESFNKTEILRVGFIFYICSLFARRIYRFHFTDCPRLKSQMAL